MGGDTTTPAAGATPDPFGLVGARLEGKYDIQSVVAEGGFGVVYRAVHRTLHKPIAVKVLKVPEGLSEALRKEFLDKFAQEARTIAQLEHPAIVRVIDFGASPMPAGEAAPWMVLEWLQGATLEEDFERRRGHGRSPAEVLAMLQPIFEALAYAHDEGIAHRDIKPGNIMLVANRRGEVSARLLDFGIAKSMAQGERASGGMTATRSALPAFSPMYAAPEQLAGSRTGPWTDVHAMALVLSEALVGSPVYPQDDNTALYAAVLSPVRPTPGRFEVQVGAWEAVLQRALSMRPDHRYGHMRDFLVALEAEVPADTARRSVAPMAEGGPRPSDPFPGLHAAYDDQVHGDEQTQERRFPYAQTPFPPTAHAAAVAPTGLAPVPSTLQPLTQNTAPVVAPSSRRVGLAIGGALLLVGVVAVVGATRSTGRVEPSRPVASSPTTLPPVTPLPAVAVPAEPPPSPPSPPSSAPVPAVVPAESPSLPAQVQHRPHPLAVVRRVPGHPAPTAPAAAPAPPAEATPSAPPQETPPVRVRRPIHHSEITLQ